MTQPTGCSTSVYLYYDVHDVLIYVGITSRGIARNVEHNNSRPWWQYVARQEVEHFPDRGLAHVREVELIERHAPPFNVQHNRHHRQMIDAYLAVRATTDHPADPDDLLRASGGRIPLHVVGEETAGFRLVHFRTEARYVSVVSRLHHVASVGLSYNGGIRTGPVVAVRQQGPFAVISARVRHELVILGAEAQVKHLNVKQPPAFALRRITLDVA